MEQTSPYQQREAEAKQKPYRLLITAGATREWIDPVRFISNPATGCIAWNLAWLAHNKAEFRGYFSEIVYIRGVVHPSFSSVDGVKTIAVESTQEMHKAVHEQLSDHCFLLMAAAPADYRLAQISERKIKKHSDDPLSLELLPTVDILKSLIPTAASLKHFYRIGFAAQTHNLYEYALSKLMEKQLDLICANHVYRELIGFGERESSILLIDKYGTQYAHGPAHKSNLADFILSMICQHLLSPQKKLEERSESGVVDKNVLSYESDLLGAIYVLKNDHHYTWDLIARILNKPLGSVYGWARKRQINISYEEAKQYIAILNEHLATRLPEAYPLQDLLSPQKKIELAEERSESGVVDKKVLSYESDLLGAIHVLKNDHHYTWDLIARILNKPLGSVYGWARKGQINISYEEAKQYIAILQEHLATDKDKNSAYYKNDLFATMWDLRRNHNITWVAMARALNKSTYTVHQWGNRRRAKISSEEAKQYAEILKNTDFSKHQNIRGRPPKT